MMTKSLACVAIAFSLASMAAAQTAEDRFLGTRWDTPGPKNAANSPPFGGDYGPGEADWSIMAAGIGIMGGDAHPGVTRAFDDLLPTEPAGTAAALFETALEMWADASPTPGQPGSGFTLLAQVADGNGLIGQGAPAPPANPGDGRTGDIRAAVIPFPDIVPSIPHFDIIAHAFRPDTDAQALFHGANSSIGGDAHFRPHSSLVINGVNWINWQPGDPDPVFGEIDLLTVMLHEVGHALGLGHNLIPDPLNPGSFEPADPTSVMVPLYMGVRQSLSASDIASIRLLYSIPEPHTGVLLMIGVVIALARRPTARVKH